MDSYDLDSLRQLARENHERRLHEADAEQLARELRGMAQKRRRLRFSIRLPLKARQRAGQPRLNG